MATIRELLRRQRFVAVAEKISLEAGKADSELILATMAACAVWEAQRPLAVIGRRRTAIDAARLRVLQMSGLSVRGIAAELGRSRSTVHRALQSMPLERQL